MTLLVRASILKQVLLGQGLEDCAATRRELVAQLMEAVQSLPTVIARTVAAYVV
jgi:hypothetical protein